MLLLCYHNPFRTLITASFSFSYLLRDFILSELGSYHCQGTHLLSVSTLYFNCLQVTEYCICFPNALQKLFVSLYFYLWYIYNLSFVIFVFLFGTCPLKLSYVTIFCTLFFLLPLCNCILTLIFCNCKGFFVFYQKLSNLPYFVSYFVYSFLNILEISRHFVYFTAHFPYVYFLFAFHQMPPSRSHMQPHPLPARFSHHSPPRIEGSVPPAKK